jgi:hypothetical protein
VELFSVTEEWICEIFSDVITDKKSRSVFQCCGSGIPDRIDLAALDPDPDPYCLLGMLTRIQEHGN